MREPVVNNVHMVIVIQPTQVLARYALHLIRELKPILPVLDEDDGHFVGPLIDEQQGRPDMDSVVCGK